MTWVACFIHTIIINYSRHHYMFFALAMQSSTSTSDMQTWIHLLFRFQKEIKKQHMKAKISLAFLFLQRTKLCSHLSIEIKMLRQEIILLQETVKKCLREAQWDQVQGFPPKSSGARCICYFLTSLIHCLNVQQMKNKQDMTTQD